MQKRAPTLANMIVIGMFALSCFGLLLFLWDSFGGPVPLKPKGYRFMIDFPQALQLAEQADVRVSGVPVGHVVSFKLAKDGHTEATIEMDHQYAPVRQNVHAILRTKTLLGETYVQLIPKGNTGSFIPDNGHLAYSHVEPTVTLDDILSLFNAKTRHDFQVWMQSASASFEGRGEEMNADFAAIPPFVSDTNKLLGVLAEQEGALRGAIKNTGVVFNALAGRDHELEGLIVNGEHTFKAAAETSQAFANAFRMFPGFERESRTALKEIDSFSTDANPLLDQSREWERQLTPLVQQLKTFSPPFERLMVGLGAFTKASKKGLPALERTLTLLTPILGNISPVLHNLDPFLQYLTEYQPELESFFGNFTAATEGHDVNSNDPTGPREHYLRTMQVLSPENLAVYSQRIGTDRANAYPQPGWFNSLSTGLPVFESKSCADSAPAVSGPANATVPESIIEQLIELHIANAPESTTNEVPAPPCNQQGPLVFNGQSSQFPHVSSSGK